MDRREPIVVREWDLQNQKGPRQFPTSRLTRDELDFYRPPHSSLFAGAFSPWPLKLGEPTRSVLRLHKRGCVGYSGDVYVCRCPRWLAYLRAELRKA